MKPKLIVAAALLFVVSVQASEVYRTTDAQGRPIYTDKPQSLPAEKIGVKTTATDPAEVQRRYDAQMQQMTATDNASTAATSKANEAEKAKELTAEDRARRCQESRQRYEAYATSRRLYEPGATEGERRYLTDAEIDAARSNAKQVMDEFCSGQ